MRPCVGGRNMRRVASAAASARCRGFWPALQLMVLLAAAAVCAAGIEPSTSPPGGLEPSKTPMFVLFAHDDAITSTTYEAMLEVTEGRQSLNGCPAVATMFTTTTNNDCELTVDLYNSGYEIADHTVSHVSMLELSKSKVADEIVGARRALADCGIPEADIVGFRAPFLESDPDVREVLHENGFLYDSSLIEEGSGASLSQGMSKRVWPFDMEGGIPMNCEWFGSIHKCEEGERYPGLYQVPVWQLTEEGGPYSMDYGDGDDGDVYDILKANFDAAYNGNRAPLPIFIHTPWLAKKSAMRGLKKFADYALSQPDTYFITVRQLLAWMESPIPTDQLTPEALGCGNPGGAPGNATVADVVLDGAAAGDSELATDDILQGEEQEDAAAELAPAQQEEEAQQEEQEQEAAAPENDEAQKAKEGGSKGGKGRKRDKGGKGRKRDKGGKGEADPYAAYAALFRNRRLSL